MSATCTQSQPAARCIHSTTDGRRCCSLVYPGHSSLCHHHLRQQLDRVPPPEDVAADILSSVENFQSAAAVNAALGRILTLLAAGRIKRRDAIAMSYICQLMLQSLKGFKQEIRLTRYEKLWERDLAKVLFSRTPLQEFISPSEPELEQASQAQPEDECAKEERGRQEQEKEPQENSNREQETKPEKAAENDPKDHPQKHRAELKPRVAA
jgi:hypothetical protein